MERIDRLKLCVEASCGNVYKPDSGEGRCPKCGSQGLWLAATALGNGKNGKDIAELLEQHNELHRQAALRHGYIQVPDGKGGFTYHKNTELSEIAEDCAINKDLVGTETKPDKPRAKGWWKEELAKQLDAKPTDWMWRWMAMTDDYIMEKLASLGIDPENATAEEIYSKLKDVKENGEEVDK